MGDLGNLMAEHRTEEMTQNQIRWYDAGTKPSREGIYEVRVPTLSARAFARWTGEYWCNWALTPRTAAKCEWRGLRAGHVWRGLLASDLISP